MYYYWKKRGIRPSVFYSMPRGELAVIQAFYQRELEDQAKMLKMIKDRGGAACPYFLFM